MGKYGVVVFEDFNSYLRMDTWNRELLDKYLVKYSIGILAFVQPSEDAFLYDSTKKTRLPVKVWNYVNFFLLFILANPKVNEVVSGTRPSRSHCYDHELQRVVKIYSATNRMARF
jgi:hypothetical protein